MAVRKKTAVDKILDEREKTHGDFSQQAACAQAIKQVMNSYYVIHPTPVQAEAFAMIANKLARIATGDPNVKDHWVDIAGYATLVADRLLP